MSILNGGHRTLMGVYFIPCLKASIIGLGQLDEMGYHNDIKHGVLCIYDSGNRLLTRLVHDQSYLNFLELQVNQPVCLSARCTETACLWHGRCGHLNIGALKRLASYGMARGLPTLDQMCDGCLVGKQW
jgi:hypothetical protein